MKNHRFYSILIFLYFAVLIQIQFTLQNPIAQKVCHTEGCLRAAQNLRDSIDPAINPCDDFYKFACGKWPKKHSNVNFFMPNSSIQIRIDDNQKELREFLRKKNTNEEPKAVHKIRQLYAMCLDTDSVYKEGTKPIKKILTECGLREEPTFDPNPSFNLVRTLAKIHKILGNGIFFVLVPTSNPYNQTQNILGISKPLSGELAPLPLIEEKKFRSIMTKSEYVKLIFEQMCGNTTSEDCQFLKNTAGLLWNLVYTALKDYEEELSQIILKQYPKTNGTTITMLNLKELQNLTETLADSTTSITPPFNWTLYLSTLYEDTKNISIDFNKPENITIETAEIDFLKDIIIFIHTHSLHLHELMTWFDVVTKVGIYTDYKISSTTNEFNGEIIGNKSREATCTEIISQVYGMAVSYYYAINPQYMDTKKEITDMVVNIRHVLKNLIEDASWMDKQTKKKALEKIDSLATLVAYPDSIKCANDLDEYYKNNLEVGDTFLGSVLFKIKQDVERELNLLNVVNKLNEDRRILTPTMVNAFYDPERNSIIIPAGILGAPVYDHSLRALVYGSIGSIVGHEITHGYDNTGSRYNSIGNLEEWWEPEALAKYKAKARCFVNAYKNYSIKFEDIKIKGDSDITLGEDIADNGGFKEALFAYRKYVLQNDEEPLLPSFENYTHEQLFTLSFANVWCENPTILSAAVAMYNEHSPHGVRVNGVAQNSDEFAKIWNCPKGSTMNPNVDKCFMW